MDVVNNQKIYDEDWPQWADLKKYGPASRWLRFLIQTQLGCLDKKNITSILDVGCGEGTITSMLASHFSNATVSGIDISSSGIDLAKKHYQSSNLEFSVDSESLALQKKHSLVCAFEVLEHVDDWQDLLRRMAENSDFLLLSFPTGRMRPFEVNVGHFRNFQKGEVEKFLADEGFSPVRILYSGFPWYSPLYRDFCNLTNSASNKVTRGEFGFFQRLAGFLIFILFKYGTTRKSMEINFVVYFKEADFDKICKLNCKNNNGGKICQSE